MDAMIVATDLMARSRLQAAAVAAGYDVVVRRAVPEAEGAPPDILVVDLDLPGALEAVTSWRAIHPDARVVGYAFHVETELMARARAVGIDVVPHAVTARPARIFS